MANLIPIKFLPASRDRNRLLKVTQILNVDKSDFVERKAAYYHKEGTNTQQFLCWLLRMRPKLQRPILQAPGIFSRSWKISSETVNICPYRIKNYQEQPEYAKRNARLSFPWRQEFILVDQRFQNGGVTMVSYT